MIALAGLAGCAGPGVEPARPDPPVGRAVPGTQDTDPTVFVVAPRQKPRIVESLAASGIAVSTELLEAEFTLRVTLGVTQGWKRCGTRNNVEYSLRREGVSLLDLTEKGWTGACTPNVFDRLSQRLAGSLSIDEGSRAAPRQP